MEDIEFGGKEHSTIKDVAKKAGVSVATVSNVLNGTKNVSSKRRKQVLEAVDALNYTPNYSAQSIRTHTGNIIGIIIPEIRNNFFAELIRGVEDRAYSTGYSTIVCNTDNSTEKLDKYISMLYSKRVSGIVFSGAWLKSEKTMDFLVEKGIPVVFINYQTENEHIDSIGVSKYTGGEKVAEYLHSLGHTDVATIKGFKDFPFEKSFDMMSGFKNVMTEKSIDRVREVECPSFTMEGGHLAMQQLLAGKDDLPSAVFCENDLIAIGAMRAVFDAGLRVPDDISIIGFDDISYSRYSVPSLTTVNVDRYKLGDYAARMIFNKLENEAKTQKLLLSPELVIRGSSGKNKR